MLVNNSCNASNSFSLYSVVRNTLQKTTALFPYRPNFGTFDSSRILLGSKVILIVGFGIAVAVFIRMVAKKRVDGTAISSAATNREYENTLSQYRVGLQNALLGRGSCPLLEPIKTAVDHPPQTHSLSNEIRQIQRLMALLEKPQSFFTTKLVENRLQLILTPDALELEWSLFCELAILLVELQPQDVYLNDQFVCPCATLQIFCASKDQCSPKELVQKVSCLLKNGKSMELTQAELRIILGYKTKTFPDELDFSDFREDTILFAKYSRIDGWKNGHQYQKHSNDQFLRCHQFFSKHHPGGLEAVKQYYFYQDMLNMLIQDSPTVKKIAWDRLELPPEEFKQEMGEFLSFFSKAEVIQIGQSPGPFHRLLRADFEHLMEQGPAAFKDTYTIVCSDGEVLTDMSAQRLRLRHACQSQEWSVDTSDSYRVNLERFSKEIVQLAIEIIKTNQYPYMIPQTAHDLYRLFDYCNFPCTELEEFLVKTPPYFSRKECQTLPWESFVEIINLYREAGQQYVHVGKETYRIDWIQKHRDKIESFGLPALATTYKHAHVCESPAMKFRKANILTQHYKNEIDQASFTTLQYLAEDFYAVQSDALFVDQVRLQMKTLTIVEFGDEDLWVEPEKYWSEINKQLETYPKAQWITLAGSEIQWNREQVTAFATHGNIQLEDLHVSQKVVFANENECFTSLSGDKITKTVCLAMWKCFSNGEDWSSIEFWMWEACWNQVFNVGPSVSIERGAKFCRPLLSPYAQSVIDESRRPFSPRAGSQ